MNDKPDPTGGCPKSELNSEGKERLKVELIAYEGKVVVDFGGEIKRIAMDPKEAIALAEGLIKTAQDAQSSILGKP